ncbi:uncharacterized protein LOC129593618 [Paramacrobiotus metropolitanus]|uniref:uncharacterized protein LOC129593618 n=1 Tax=Paramacrobiotus metropolitanus TaxID=2943436 RepID=UPI0024461205|nr:uncharacterized protein LOC129593618 [Paramacrobiotus metropolitanus]
MESKSELFSGNAVTRKASAEQSADPLDDISSQKFSINILNTILVPEAEGVWCMGYVREVKKDSVLVDFQSCIKKPSWISSRLTVIPPTFQRPIGPPGKSVRKMNVNVAVRSTRDHPLKLQHGVLLSKCSYSDNYLCYVDLGVNETLERRVVHRCQLSSYTALLSSSVNHCGQYVRHEIPFADASLMVSVNTARLQRAVKYARQDRLRDNITKQFGYEERFHFHVERDTAVFVCLEQLSTSKVWTDEALHAVVCNCSLDGTFRFSLELPRQILLPREAFIEDGLEKARLAVFMLSELLVEIFIHLDLYSQALAKRVCWLWKEVISGIKTDHRIINLSSYLPERDPWDNDKGYYLASLLDHAFTRQTRTLLLEHWSLNWKALNLFCDLSSFRGVRFLAIRLENCKVAYEVSRPCKSCEEKLLHLDKLLAVSRHVILTNYTITGVLAEFTLSSGSIPNWLRNFKKTQLKPDARSLRIRRLRLNYAAMSREECFRAFLRASEAGCPQVPSWIHVNSLKMYYSWVDSATTDSDWSGLRELLFPWNTFRLPHVKACKDLQNADLEQLQPEQFTKLALYMLHYANYA